MVGKEERNKDFMEALTEDRDGNVIGNQGLNDYSMEGGEASKANEKVDLDESRSRKDGSNGRSSTDVNEKPHVEQMETI